MFVTEQGTWVSFFLLELSNGIFCFGKNSEVLKVHLHAANITVCFWRVHPKAYPQPALVSVSFRT